MKKLFISLFVTITAIIIFAACCSAASMSYDNGTLTIENMSDGGLVVQASYDGNGALESVKLHDDVHNGENELTANEGDRLFLWNGTKTMKPECTVIVVGSVNTAEPVTEPKSDTNNILMVYFSRAGENWQVGTIDKGNTAEIADYILENVDADVFEIKATDPYPVSYNETLTRVNRERDNNERPSFEGKIENLDQYDTVFIGYPIWYGGLPMIIYTFLEEYDLGDKMIIPFSTHGGSGWGSTKSELKTLIPNGNFVDGYSIAGTEARKDMTKEAVKKWLEGIELPKKAKAQEDMVLAAYNTIQQAMVDADIPTLRRVIKDDKTFTHMSGKVQTKEEYLADIESGALDYQSYKIENPTVTVDGNYAKLTARTTLTANAYGAQGSWPFNTTAWFENVSGEWINCNEPK